MAQSRCCLESLDSCHSARFPRMAAHADIYQLLFCRFPQPWEIFLRCIPAALAFLSWSVCLPVVSPWSRHFTGSFIPAPLSKCELPRDCSRFWALAYLPWGGAQSPKLEGCPLVLLLVNWLTLASLKTSLQVYLFTNKEGNKAYLTELLWILNAIKFALCPAINTQCLFF